MVLVVKLKNPNRRAVDADGAQLSDSSLEYRSAAEPDSSVSPQADSHDSHNGDLDELSAALQKTQIDPTGDVAVKIEAELAQDMPRAAETEASLPVQASTDHATRPAVDVLIAPAVLGHRWVRTRANSFVVERPERIRAVSLGVAAVLGKEQDEGERRHVDVDSMVSHLSSLSVEGGHGDSKRQQVPSLAVHLSDCRLSLSNPSPALRMIHALEEEYLTVERVNEANMTPSAATEDASKLTLSYATYLDQLCANAASDVPPPLAPKSVRHGISPRKVQDEIEVEPAEHKSEVPPHLPQGDLYLCGSKSSIKAEATPTSNVQLGDAIVDDVPHTPKKEESEEDKGLPQDLYKDEEAWRKEGSKGAIEAALGTGCAAVDRVVAASLATRPADSAACSSINVLQLQEEGGSSSSSQVDREPATRSFVIVRPPGHHCNATQPSGFCWVNNAAVMAAHAFHEHGIDRIAILDFDLHHGNGTQAIAWRINADTVRHDLERDAKLKAMRSDLDRKMKRTPQKSNATPSEHPTFVPMADKRGLKMFYGSLHDIESFPCEDGNKELITDASMCIEGAHGQWIWNVHLDAHTDAADAQRLYQDKYYQLIDKARSFFTHTDASPQSSLILISAGFDACIHEQAGMQRHGKSVPPQFYEMFTRDVVTLAEERCAGKCISILEGGYSDRALTSATIAHLIGLGSSTLAGSIYQPSNLYQLEKLAKAASSLPSRRKQDALTRDGLWLDYTLEAFRRLEDVLGRRRSEAASRTNPSTPTRAMLDQLWKSPRETRSHRGPMA